MLAVLPLKHRARCSVHANAFNLRSVPIDGASGVACSNCLLSNRLSTHACSLLLPYQRHPTLQREPTSNPYVLQPMQTLSVAASGSDGLQQRGPMNHIRPSRAAARARSCPHVTPCMSPPPRQPPPTTPGGVRPPSPPAPRPRRSSACCRTPLAAAAVASCPFPGIQCRGALSTANTARGLPTRRHAPNSPISTLPRFCPVAPTLDCLDRQRLPSPLAQSASASRPGLTLHLYYAHILAGRRAAASWSCVRYVIPGYASMLHVVCCRFSGQSLQHAAVIMRTTRTVG